MSSAGSTESGGADRAGIRATRGFTLIELLVVLTLIALMASLATPMIQRSMPGLELKTAAEELRAELRLARSAAIRDNRETWLLVDVGAGEYRQDGAGRRRVVPPQVRLALVTASSEQLDDLRGRIRFYPDGTSTGGAVRLIRDALAYEVSVDWFDGRVSIDESAAE